MEPDEIVLCRDGHYFNAGNGGCQAAKVAHVFGEGAAVNIQVLDQSGQASTRTSVAVKPTPAIEDTSNSFHLTRQCPWGR